MLALKTRSRGQPTLVIPIEGDQLLEILKQPAKLLVVVLDKLEDDLIQFFPLTVVQYDLWDQAMQLFHDGE